MKNQLFRRNPDRYIINDLMIAFKIKSLTLYPGTQPLTLMVITNYMQK